MEIPTTFAEAPIGVALPPISVPMARDQAKTGRAIPETADRLLITGIIVAAKGILSTKALAIPDIHIIMITIRRLLPWLNFSIKEAITSRTPVCSKPPTTMKRPIKNSRVFRSIFLRISGAFFQEAIRVRKAIITPMRATVKPVDA